ncbi:MAG TPA: 50S ribosomal protein L15 [Candidatus Sulfomarinibacteraceae bacterium]|nr:50S ribosomal protein L15 [Candidatus Sulfomarinibacteraceae bacterium]
MKLNDLRPDRGSKKKRKRVGRGTGSGYGKTAGRGTKGQNARSGGGVPPYFEGGQLPLVRRLPLKRGFKNPKKIIYKPVNVGELVGFDEGTEVDPVVLAIVGLVKKPTDPIVILGDGEIDVALTVKAHRFSKSAREKIEKAGGMVEVLPVE